MVKRNLQLDALRQEGKFLSISPLASRTSGVEIFNLGAFSEASTLTSTSSSPTFSTTWNNEEMKNRIYDEFCRGIGAKELSQKFGRAVASIYRIVGARKAADVFSLPLDYIPSPEFERALGKPQAEAQIFEVPAQMTFSSEMDEKNERNGSNVVRKRTKRDATAPSAVNDASFYWTRIDDVPLLKAEEESFLFRKFNFLKFKANRLRETLDPKRPKLILADEIEKLWNEAVATKKRIVSANLRLVVSVAKKYAGGSTSFSDLVGDGNVSLVKAVEKFDYTTGNRFSTYATWALYRNFARSIPDEQKQLERFRASDVAMLELKQDDRTSPRQAERVYTEQTLQVKRFMSELSDREREIIELRFGIGGRVKPQTLRQVGKDMGVTKERVRQIEMRALAKLRKVAQEEKFELPEICGFDS